MKALFGTTLCFLGLLRADAAAPVAADIPFLAPEAAARQMTVPAGFRVTLFAGEPDVTQPIAFCIDDRGRLWVVENHSYPNWNADAGKDRVVIFEDTNGDGRFDRRTVFATGLNYVTGIEVGFGGVWLVNSPHLLFIPDRDGDDRPDGPPEVLLEGFGREGIHNLVNGFTWGPDGWLYGGHGGSSYSKLGKPGTSEEQRVHVNGGVWRYHPTRHVVESFAQGTTNPWGIAFNEHGHIFISNCVLPHLYHMVQGGYYERRRPSPLSRHAYATLDTIADHRHWVGADWAKSRGGDDQLAVGGGHAHSGAMIYLGDSFPDDYRGVMFMVNIHGKRVNNDILARRGSGYVGRHGKDFMLAADRRFLGVGLQYGPDGSVFLSDWSDPDECHTRKPDRATGRIFKISYGDRKPALAPVNLAKLSDAELVKLQLYKNDWFVAHARRLLQERAAAGTLASTVRPALEEMLEKEKDATRQLRALWALHVMSAGDEPLRLRLLNHPQEHLRAWAVQFELEDNKVSEAMLAKLEAMASAEPSPLVRLYLASACQRLPHEQRWVTLTRLAARTEDATDANLPLMIWYALEPLVPANPERALALASQSKFPRLREFVARRLTSP